MAADKVQLDSIAQWEGNLSKAAENGAQFALYLAMQFGASVGEPKIKPYETAVPSDKAFVDRLNFYRRPALDANKADHSHSHRLSQFIAQGDICSARLQDAMHPEPLSFHNDATRIPDDVVANCSLATQRRLKGDTASDIEEDNTLLDDIIEQANEYRVA
ncbi:VC2046/SO_2500 family protein [Alteromonas halophila]|uniref:Uncharacterized protein n=1 Tax=Alteromonas halophila TaxID=516698 RepID=A0A918JNJ1_9ALTE|nr:VC2046/SO_2500 family protein [Alteromonas halophila]GGW88334.1 hypothetical protein GCM10007391_22820 [Alteromonas halophila]